MQRKKGEGEEKGKMVANILMAKLSTMLKISDPVS